MQTRAPLASRALCITALLTLLAVASLAGAAGAGTTDPKLYYQGQLVDVTTGAALSGTYTITFRLYDLESGGPPLWTEIQDVNVDGGLFGAELGAIEPLDITVFDGRRLWIGLKIGSDSEAVPRQRLAYHPMALYADNAASLEGLTSADFALTGHIHDSRYYTQAAADSVFVNQTGPDAVTASSSAAPALRVTQTGSQNAVEAITSSTDAGEAALKGVAGAPAATINSEAGVFGTSASGRGVIGSSVSRDGVFGFSQSAAGLSGQSTQSDGVRGLALATSGVTYGVLGTASSTGGGAGVRGDGEWVGVWGDSSGRWGLYGRSTGTANAYGVYGTVAAGTGNFAGYFAGNVNVTGSIAKGSGSFKIDHPLDPENRYLYHSFIESPDMMNVYNGNVVLDAQGVGVVQLPAYFEALNRDFRYQLTPIGGAAPNLHVAEKIKGNAFRIAGGPAGLEVSWQVTGVRQDPYAEANRIQVEVDKPESERGTYLHPEAYDLAVPKRDGKRVGLDTLTEPTAARPSSGPER